MRRWEATRCGASLACTNALRGCELRDAMLLLKLIFERLELALEGLNSPIDDRLALMCRPLHKMIVTKVHMDLIGVLQTRWDESNIAEGNHDLCGRFLRELQQILAEFAIGGDLSIILSYLFVQRLQVRLNDLLGEFLLRRHCLNHL